MTKLLVLFSVFSSFAFADENLLGYVRGAETLPKGSWELYQFVTSRDDKGTGSYHAFDTVTEVEYGLTDRFNVAAGLWMMALNTNGLIIDAYMPGDNRFNLKPSGIEFEAKYNFLSPAKDDFGLSVIWSLYNFWVDAHSGRPKDSYAFETLIAAQKYFMEGQLIWTGNVGLEATHARRHAIDDRPPGEFEWPAHAEMEIETILGTGLSYRFMNNWFAGAETRYEVEYETEVGRERFSLFAGPTIHYGGEKFWATLTWFPQIEGGGQAYPGQPANLQLVEKTKTETRLKLGFNF